ncbi:MAG: ABC transporter substrate-binding protein [Lachnospiraceae bacterium]|nr:ABC transporter substrate-binding protein [Lachnospiraceae bacterium]
MKKKQHILILFLSLLLCVWMIGCQGEESATEQPENVEQIQEQKDEIVIAVNVDGSSTQLPFENVWMNRSKFWGSLIFQGLLIADENISNVKSDLCEEYIISADGKKYTFILKDDLFWHDGVELTAEDVVWSLETFFKVQETNGFVKKGLQEIQGVGNYEKGLSKRISGISYRGKEITITLLQEDSNFLTAIAQLAILPKHCLEKVPLNEFAMCDFWSMPIGSGPYKIASSEDNKEALLVVNENYSGRKPEIERIRYKVLENPETDYFDFALTSDPLTVNKYEWNPNYNVVKTNNLYYRYLFFNLDERTGENEKLLQNANVRKALMLAIDKENILEEIYGGAAFSIDCGVPQYDSWYVEKEEASYNPELAKQMLLNERFDFSKTIVLTRYSMDDLSVRLLERIAECWEEVGVKVEIIPVEGDSTNKLFVEADWYDVALKNLSAVDYTEWYYEYSSDNQLWSTIMHNRKEFNILIYGIDRAAFAHEFKNLYSEIQLLENSVVYKIPLAIVPQYVIYNKEHMYIPEMTFPNLWYHYDLNIADWSLIKEDNSN